MIALPAYAYIPGKTERHPEGAFDAICATAQPEMEEAGLAETKAMRAGLLYLQEGFFWEAHEVLEPVWLACPPNSSARRGAQALIQLANAQLKLRAGNPAAAERILTSAKSHLAEVRFARRTDVLGVPVDSIGVWIDTVGEEIEHALKCISGKIAQLTENER